MKSFVSDGEACPMCRSRAHEASRSRYIGAGEFTTGYLVRVWSCTTCKREWEDAALSAINTSRENSARRAYWEAVSDAARLGAVISEMQATRPHESTGAFAAVRNLGRTG